MKHMLKQLTVFMVLFISMTAWAAQPDPFVLVTLGDSITKGVREGVAESETFASLIEERLDAVNLPVTVINAGIGGERTDQALERLDDIIDMKPDCVTIMYGTNDAYIDRGKTEPRLTLEEYEDNLRAIVFRLKRAHIQPVLMTEPVLGTFPGSVNEPYRSRGRNFMMIPYMNAVRHVAAIMDVPLADHFRVWSEEVLGGRDMDEWLTDGMHPNPAGHIVLTETLYDTLESQVSMRTKGYTIPTIDLADERDRQIVIDREAGQYLGHPTTVLLEDGRTMIAVYPKGHGRGAIVMKRSTDGGLTWSERLPVPDNWSTSQEVPTIYRTIDPDGVKRLIMFSGLYPNRMAFSEDDGTTWSPLEPIGDHGGIVSMSDMIRLEDGRYMALFHDDGRFFDNSMVRSNRFRVFRILSDDGGLTWGPPAVVAEHRAAHLCEPGLIRSPDGKRIAMLLRENSRRFNSFVTFSDDEGETWSRPTELPASLTGDRHKGLYTPDGRIVFVFRDKTYESPTQGDFVAWVGSFDDIAKGREGQYRVRLLDNTRGSDCGYPGIELLPDGTIVATTYGHWTKGEQPYIISVRFTMDEIDTKAADMK